MITKHSIDNCKHVAERAELDRSWAAVNFLTRHQICYSKNATNKAYIINDWISSRNTTWRTTW